MAGIVRITGACILFCLLAVPGRAANEIQPGLWQDTETGEVNGKPQPSKVSTDCIKSEDAKDPVKAARASMKDMDAKQCGKFDIKESGNIILLALKCGDPKQGAMDISVVWTIVDSQHTTSVVQSEMTFGGQKLTSNLKTESKWIAAECKGKQ
jgi:hypothetical protein